MMLMIMIMLMLLFPLMKHPLSMGLILILQTISISMLSGMMINSFWFSYMLLISMLSGMLVLFIYMASIASNKKFSTPKTTPMIIMLIMLMMVITLNQEEINLSYTELPKTMFYNYDQLMPMTKMFYYQSLSMTMIMVSYLLITMISVTFTVNITEGPMRKKS
uniref:NADH-ubiquinone oxidoreductase chain 6 n=1 Tax=Scotomedes sp. TaxID=2931908 RepID=A0A8T9W2I9_9HEMI|nr:NADH dehydrogenase subunit 6 [Scotomedes sp.]